MTEKCNSLKFKVGDRVAVYGPFAPKDGGGLRSISGEHGTVILAGPLLEVRLDDDSLFGRDGDVIDMVHPKQCRRLKKRERRKWTMQACTCQDWMAMPSNHRCQPIVSGPRVTPGETVEVVEVKRVREE